MQRTFLIIAALATALAAPTGAAAEDGGQRINLAGKLRMLSQRTAAATCYDAVGVAPGEATATLEGATDEFEAILSALRDGDPALGIHGPEKDRRVLQDIAALRAAWDPIRGDLDAVIDGTAAPIRYRAVVMTEPRLLEVAKHLVVMVTGQHADPFALTQDLALTIDVAGRQRMLAQRMSKNACKIAAGLEPRRAAGELSAAREIYGATLSALRHGMPEAGVVAPPTAEIEAALGDVAGLWARFDSLLDTVVRGDATEAHLADLMRLADASTATMNGAVGLYAAYAEQRGR